MGIFDKRPKYAFSDILKGLHNAVNSAQDMLQAQQVQNLRRFWNPEDGEPISQKIKIGDKEMNVPLMSIGAVASDSMSDGVVIGSPLTHSDLKMEMEGIKATDDDVMEVTIRFSQKDTPEGVARLTDEYNKLI